MGQKVVICGINTSELPTLKSKELYELLLKVKAGDESARQKFIYSNMKLVLSVVQRFSKRKESVDDLFQVGCVGLIKAIDNFNVDLGVKFSTYAVPMIIGEIRRFIRDNSTVRVSRSLRDIAYKALKAREELSVNKDYEPSLDEIAAKINLPLFEVVCALDAISETVSLEEPAYNDGVAHFVKKLELDATDNDDVKVYLEAVDDLGYAHQRLVFSTDEDFTFQKDNNELIIDKDGNVDYAGQNQEETPVESTEKE